MMASLYPHPMPVDEVLEVAGLQEVAGQRTQKLSGGQTQRARFAVAMAGDPRLLVLDEPTVGLDVEARRSFWLTMRRFTARGKTILFATHYLDEADASADRVILLSKGRVVGRRTADGDQGAGELPHDPARRCPAFRSRAWRSLPASRACSATARWSR